MHLNTHGISLERLDHFLRFAEHQSIRKAAHGDTSKQSLISRQIKELESYFGTPLTQRRGRGLVLTDAGHQLATIIRRQFTMLSDFNAEQHHQPPTVTIAAGMSNIHWLIHPHIAALESQHHLHITCQQARSRDTPTLLNTAVVDLAIVRQSALSDHQHTHQLRQLFVTDYALYGDPHKPLARLHGQGHLAMHLTDLLGSKSHHQINCDSQLQIAALIIDNLACGILPTFAEISLNKHPGIPKHPLKEMQHYHRTLTLAATNIAINQRPIVEKLLHQLAQTITSQHTHPQ